MNLLDAAQHVLGDKCPVLLEVIADCGYAQRRVRRILFNKSREWEKKRYEDAHFSKMYIRNVNDGHLHIKTMLDTGREIIEIGMGIQKPVSHYYEWID